jgi:hypothetical protein
MGTPLSRESHPQQVKAEVLELGQTLFDAVLEAAASPPAGEAASEPFPAEEVRAAAEEFFHALRLLLGLEGD